MVHKISKEVYRLRWRPVNPDGTLSVGVAEEQWITDPSFRFKTPERAWDEFGKAIGTTVFADVQLIKDGKILHTRLWKERMKYAY